MKSTRATWCRKAAFFVMPLIFPIAAWAHAAEQGLVLLLPTDIYITAGVASVALTVVVLALLPADTMHVVFRALPITRRSFRWLRPWSSFVGFLLLAALVWAGVAGPRDPLTNPLPLMVWTVWWIALVTLQGLIGDLWAFVNPWTGPVALVRRLTGPAPLRLPTWLGQSLGIASFLAFALVLLADPAPADPDRLARYVAAYWLYGFLGAVLFGPRWTRRAEGISMVLTLFARLAAFGRYGGALCVGLWGWQIVRRRPPPLGTAILAVVALGTGSFDGLNETFWWLGQIGINPLEFPGRSAVVWQSTLGLIAANLALLAVIALTVHLGVRIAGATEIASFRTFAPSVLPIALGYHVAHYLTSFLVDGQYALAALSDPFLTGADYLGLGTFYVTTGFFNTQESVRLIFLAQAGAVVLGHILAVLVAHVLAVGRFGSSWRATLSQAPLAAFMIGYTLFGLWLLASPRF